MTKRQPRGRPRAFDKEAMLHKIMHTFWVRGFAGTSLDDLASITGLSRSSLYAAYGSKSAMYLAAMTLFQGQIRETALPALQNAPDLEAALAGFYGGALDLYFGNRKQALGCMVFTTAVADAGSDAGIKRAVGGFLSGMDEAIAACIAAHTPGITADQALALGGLAGGMLMNLATRARAGATRADLDVMAQASATLIAQAARAAD